MNMNPNINILDQLTQPDPNDKFNVVVTLDNGGKMFPVLDVDIFTATSVMHLAKRRYFERTGRTLHCHVKQTG